MTTALRPSFLDSYALVSGQLNTMVKNIKSDRTPSFKRYICLPLTLSQDRDEELARSTEGRIGQFSHDLVPDYLRTKPDPEVEARHALYESRVATLNPEQMHKQLGVMEKMTKEMLKHITKVSHLSNNGKDIFTPFAAVCILFFVCSMSVLL